jgi:site-specific recombinase XerD
MKNEESSIDNILPCARHTFSTVALSLGIDIIVIRKILGHKELGTTRIYAKLQDKRKIEEMKKWETV